MSSNASQSRNRPSTDGEKRPARRQRLVEEDFGEPDLLMLSDDNVEYLAHRSMLSASCRLFSDMFDIASSDASHNDLPRIPLLADSATIEMVLPLAYRTSAANLRTKSFKELEKCIRLAHRLGMPLVVDTFAIYLETYIPKYGFELYKLARTLGLTHLEGLCRHAAMAAHDLALPTQHVAEPGQVKPAELHEAKFDKLFDYVTWACSSSDEFHDALKACPVMMDYRHVNRHCKHLKARSVITGSSVCAVMKLFAISRHDETAEEVLDEWDDLLFRYVKFWESHPAKEKECPVYRQLMTEMKELENRFNTTLALPGRTAHTATLHVTA